MKKKTSTKRKAVTGRTISKKIARKKIARKPITAEERRQMIADLAYLKSEARGGRPGDAMQDWLDAEAEIDARLSATPPALTPPAGRG